MKQTSKRLLSIGVAIIGIIGALIVFFNLVQPEYANMEDLKGQAAGRQDLLTSEGQAVKQVQQLVSSYKSGSNAKVALAVPTGQDLAGALTQIYGLAQNTGIAIQGIGISTPSLQQPSSAAPQLIRPLGTIAFQVAATGSYENLKNFLSGLETNVRIFDLKTLAITPGALPGSFTYSISVTTYYQTWQ